MQRTRPPFRADMVGSLLRTEPLKRARAARAEGSITADELRAVEDREIEKILARQAGGRPPVGDRRRVPPLVVAFRFPRRARRLRAGPARSRHPVPRRPDQGRDASRHRQGRLAGDHPMIDHFKFLKDHTRLVPKMTIPSPSVLHFRSGYNAIKPVYPGHRRVLRRRRDRLRQGDPRLLRRRLPLPAARRHGLGLSLRRRRSSSRRRSAATTSAASRSATPAPSTRRSNAKPADMTITMHVCRGNFRSTWISSGGYEPVAETLLAKLDIDGYFLEYDTERAGGFEPLRFLPKGEKVVVLGLITSKSGTLENKDDVKRRIDEATKYVAARPARAVAAMRLRLDRGGQHPHRGGAVGEAPRDRRDRRTRCGIEARCEASRLEEHRLVLALQADVEDVARQAVAGRRRVGRSASRGARPAPGRGSASAAFAASSSK